MIGHGQSSKTIQKILELSERDLNETIGYFMVLSFV